MKRPLRSQFSRISLRGAPISDHSADLIDDHSPPSLPYEIDVRSMSLFHNTAIRLISTLCGMKKSIFYRKLNAINSLYLKNNTSDKMRYLLHIVVGTTLISCSGNPAAITPRPKTWARSIEVAGVPNLYRIDKNLYRSAQPTAEGMNNLKSIGIKTVINLRYFGKNSDDEIDQQLRHARIPTLTWAPSDNDVDRFVRLVSNPVNGPFLVHCYHGSDRTGAMCAIYRVKFQGWAEDEAINEMLHGGYGFHSIWQNLLPWTKKEIETVDSHNPLLIRQKSIQ